MSDTFWYDIVCALRTTHFDTIYRVFQLFLTLNRVSVQLFVVIARVEKNNIERYTRRVIVHDLRNTIDGAFVCRRSDSGCPPWTGSRVLWKLQQQVSVSFALQDLIKFVSLTIFGCHWMCAELALVPAFERVAQVLIELDAKETSKLRGLFVFE